MILKTNTYKEKQMEITDKIVLREANITSEDDNYPNRVNVRACTDSAKWKNIAIEQCEDEGGLFVGLCCANSSIEYTEGDISMQIRIEDVPVLMNQMRQAYKKQVVKQHLNKWGNNNENNRTR